MMAKRTPTEWILDLFGLFAQGVCVPLISWGLGHTVYSRLFERWHPDLHWNVWFVFLVVFIVTDYLYYWNHRLLHTQWLWPLHELHHSSRMLDVFSTSRNSLWTPLVVVYLWTQPFALGLFAQAPQAVACAGGLNAVLDVWRHSSLNFTSGSWIEGVIGSVFILPKNHAWHHSTEESGICFGANLNVWDRLHGTWKFSVTPPPSVGFELQGRLLDRFLFPWKGPV